MRILIASIYVLLSQSLFSQLQGMDAYKEVKGLKIKEGYKCQYELFGIRSYFFSSSDSMNVIRELNRVFKVNCVPLEALRPNSWVEELGGEVKVWYSERKKMYISQIAVMEDE